MTYREEFPQFEMDVRIPPQWEDVSDLEDGCPCFRTRHGEDSVDVFIDHVAATDQVHQNGYRFHVVESTEGGCLYQSNEWNDVLGFLGEIGLEAN